MLVKVRHFVASRTNAPAVVVAVVFTLMALKCAVKKLLTYVFTLDHFVTTQRTVGTIHDSWVRFTCKVVRSSETVLMALKWPIMCWCAVKKLLTHVFTLDHFVTTQRTMEWTKSLLDQFYDSSLRAGSQSVWSRPMWRDEGLYARITGSTCSVQFIICCARSNAD